MTTIGLVTNFRLIYMILIGITDLFMQNLKESQTQEDYFDLSLENDSELKEEV